MDRVLLETYMDLAAKDVALFSTDHSFANGADACVVECQGMYGVFLNFRMINSERKEKVAVVHEWAHIMEGATYSTKASPALIQKFEHRAHRREIKKLLPFEEMKAAIQNEFLSNNYEIAEYFNVPEEIVQEAIEYYTGQCGLTFQEEVRDVL